MEVNLDFTLHQIQLAARGLRDRDVLASSGLSPVVETKRKEKIYTGLESFTKTDKG